MILITAIIRSQLWTSQNDLKGEKEMKDYTTPEFYFTQLFEDLLTLSNNGTLGIDDDNIVFDWGKLTVV